MKAAVIEIPAIGADGADYPVEKMEAHRKGLLHHAISVFVTDGARALIQQRALSKYHCGGLWANACCSHPHWGESAESAARRRPFEELGARLDPVRVGGAEYRADVGGGLIEHERVAMFTALVDPDALVLALNPEEVAATRWVTRDELEAERAAAPAVIAPWFAIYLDRFPALPFAAPDEARAILAA